MNRISSVLATIILPLIANAQNLAILDGITFDDEKGALYLPVRDIGAALDWKVAIGKDGKTVYLNNKPVENRIRKLPNSVSLVSLAELKRRGLEVTMRDSKMRKVRIKRRAFLVREGTKRVVINKTHMVMSAWQGQRVVFSSPVTLGIEGNDTPTGLFKAQAQKEKLHRSRLYKNAPMPWSVRIVGNIYVHGWPNVTRSRGSHGCIRLPLNSGNPARFFYYWAESGTPVSILGKWPRGAKFSS